MLADLDSLEKRVPSRSRRRPRAATRKPRSRSISSIAASCCCARASRRGSSAVEPEERKLFAGPRPAVLEARALRLQRRGGFGRQAAMRFGRASRARAPRKGAVSVVVSAKIESEIAVLPPEEQKDYLDAHRPGGAGPQPRDPGRLRAAASRDLLHRRAEGGAGLDDPAGHPRARRRPASSTAISRRASSARKPSPTTTTWPTGARPARASGQVPARRQGLRRADGDVLHFRFATLKLPSARGYLRRSHAARPQWPG